jgi:hypothetical protein
VQPHDEVVVVAGVKDPVFDHAGSRSDQRKGVRVVAAVVARDVEHAAQLAIRGAHRRGGAGQEAVALEVVLGAMYDHGPALGQRGANGVGATVGFVPQSARAQRDTVSARNKVQVTQAVQQEATRIRQNHQAARVTHLVGHEGHDRAGVRQEVVLAGQGGFELLHAAQGRLVVLIDRAEARVVAALPRLHEGGVHQAVGHLT